MARKVFFSFHFDRDSRRVAQVRNAHVIGFYEKPPFLDAAEWETVKAKGDNAIKKWIDDNLVGSSVTIVLIGAETYKRPWVKYEIEQSYKRGNGLLGITLHSINDPLTGRDIPGQNPFAGVKDNRGNFLSNNVPVYDWINNNGRENIAAWVESAARLAGR
ncbi:MAG: TIR domain-containing protein [Chitinophagaceae bacterium]|nr:TIR domain-containing protein [Chitinophagaceae bacterium]